VPRIARKDVWTGMDEDPRIPIMIAEMETTLVLREGEKVGSQAINNGSNGIWDKENQFRNV
jgi:hypothetical protein